MKEFISIQKLAIKKAKDDGVREGKMQEKLEIAKNLLLSNVDIEVISRTTSLSVKQIKDLKSVVFEKD